MWAVTISDSTARFDWNRTTASDQYVEMSKSFEKYLYRKFRAVYVHGLSELATNIRLLDILLKKESEGVFPRRPVLKRAGSMIELGTGSSVEDLREGLSDFEDEDPIGHELFDWAEGDYDAEESFGSARSLTGSLFAGPLADLGAHFSHSKNCTVKFEGLYTACVSKDKLVEYVMVDNLWKPNVEDPRLEWPGDVPSNCVPSFGSRGGRTLWVIHQILFASKLEVTSGGTSDSVGARLATVVPGAPGAQMSVSREGSNVLNLTIGTKTKFPGKFMFAFRAIRFRFNAAGEIIGREDDAGKHRPTYRADDAGLYDDAGAQIRGLFLEEPTEDEDEEEGEWDVHRLPIEN